MLAPDQTKVTTRSTVNSLDTEACAVLQRYTVPEGVGKRMRALAAEVRTPPTSLRNRIGREEKKSDLGKFASLNARQIRQDLLKISHYEPVKTVLGIDTRVGFRVRQHTSPKEQTVFRQRYKNRAPKKVTPAELTTKPILSMDDQRIAWNEELLKRWRFESGESFARMHLGSNAQGNTRQLAHQLRRHRQCFAVLQGHRWLFPVFQIDPDTKRPYPEILALIGCYPGMAKSNRSFPLLRWMDQEHSELSGATPMQIWERGDRAAVVRALKTEL